MAKAVRKMLLSWTHSQHSQHSQHSLKSTWPGEAEVSWRTWPWPWSVDCVDCVDALSIVPVLQPVLLPLGGEDLMKPSVTFLWEGTEEGHSAVLKD